MQRKLSFLKHIMSEKEENNEKSIARTDVEIRKPIFGFYKNGILEKNGKIEKNMNLAF